MPMNKIAMQFDWNVNVVVHADAAHFARHSLGRSMSRPANIPTMSYEYYCYYLHSIIIAIVIGWAINDRNILVFCSFVGRIKFLMANNQWENAQFGERRFVRMHVRCSCVDATFRRKTIDVGAMFTRLNGSSGTNTWTSRNRFIILKVVVMKLRANRIRSMELQWK